MTPENNLDHYSNKPFGIKHWLENAKPSVALDVIIIILDPDMLILRPLTAKVGADPNLLMHMTMNTRRRPIMQYVTRGHPVGQMYAMEAPWAADSSSFNRLVNIFHFFPISTTCLVS